eukprot:m.1316 g.1316  ORF g.1316 m.1316 type:complete len:647 (+) comp6097_c0_seq1:114-2054(+)
MSDQEQGEKPGNSTEDEWSAEETGGMPQMADTLSPNLLASNSEFTPSSTDTELEQWTTDGSGTTKDDSDGDNGRLDGDSDSDEEKPPVSHRTASQGTQTEWSWIADLIAFANVQGIDVESSVETEAEQMATIRLSLDAESVATLRSEVSRRSTLTPSVPTASDNISTATRLSTPLVPLHRADFPEILRYIRESELPPLPSRSPPSLMRPSTVPPSTSLPACIRALCRLCDVNTAERSQSELTLYCSTCTRLLEDHTHTMQSDDEISLIDIATARSGKKSRRGRGNGRASSEGSGSSSAAFHRLVSPKEKRKAGRERAMAKLRERELEAKMREHEMARQRALGDPYLAMYDRNMKTITYALSSQRCLDKGWTLKPPKPRPPSSEVKQPDAVEMKDHLAMAKGHVLERFYPDGKQFLLFMPDGSGQCYYPSGNVAICVASYEPGFNYVIKADGKRDLDGEKENAGHSIDEDDDGDQLLAYFSPTGHGCCYHSNGVAHLVLEPGGGAAYGVNGEQKKIWRWRDSRIRHQHVPPCQPIWFTLNEYISIRCSDQDNVTMTFSCQQRTVRFSVGWNLKWKFGSRPSAISSGGEAWRRSLKLGQRRLNGLLVGLHDALKYPQRYKRGIVELTKLRSGASEMRDQMDNKVSETV